MVMAACANAGENGRLEIIVNSNVAADSVDIAVARSIFTRKLTRWQDGSTIRVFVLADNHPAHREFVKEKLGLFPYQLRQIWDRMVFSGIEEAPEVVETIGDMYQVIKETPGAIGYAPVDDTMEFQGVRYVTLD